jgi:hypothetical protein
VYFVQYRDKVVGVFVRFSCAASGSEAIHVTNVPKLPTDMAG